VRNKKLPKEVTDHWPDVLEDVDVEVIPIDYLYSIRITFDDNITWDIAINEDDSDIDIENALDEVLNEYEDNIVNIDFRLNTQKVKEDITSRTNIFMKKRK
jgi:hypothetical protein